MDLPEAFKQSAPNAREHGDFPSEKVQASELESAWLCS
jgi:hypothetical protein